MADIFKFPLKERASARRFGFTVVEPAETEEESRDREAISFWMSLDTGDRHHWYVKLKEYYDRHGGV